MKIAYSPYELKPKIARPSRQGALLRIEFEEGSVGYADCHPWESLGDLSLSHQLAGLKQGRLTPLTTRSLHFARLDAVARSKKVSLFEGLKVPSSHYLILDLLLWQQEGSILPNGYSRLKIKMGQNIKAETQALNRLLKHCGNVQVRLDFNNRLTELEFESLLKTIDRSKIEFCEDPFPYEPTAWRAIQENYEVPLALDHGSERAIHRESCARYLVVKPAVQDEQPFLAASQQKIVVTSYLDHPLGQMAAAYVAGQMKKAVPGMIQECGLLSHLAYAENVFSAAVSLGPHFIGPAGMGLGFDERLGAQQFIEL